MESAAAGAVGRPTLFDLAAPHAGGASARKDRKRAGRRIGMISVGEQSVGMKQVADGLGSDVLQCRIPRRSLKSCRRILPIDISGTLDAEIGQYETRCFADVREALD
jgi:hypothetical protein